jgi:hypothetical protein
MTNEHPIADTPVQANIDPTETVSPSNLVNASNLQASASEPCMDDRCLELSPGLYNQSAQRYEPFLLFRVGRPVLYQLALSAPETRDFLATLSTVKELKHTRYGVFSARLQQQPTQAQKVTVTVHPGFHCEFTLSEAERLRVLLCEAVLSDPLRFQYETETIRHQQLAPPTEVIDVLGHGIAGSSDHNHAKDVRHSTGLKR